MNKEKIPNEESTQETTKMETKTEELQSKQEDTEHNEKHPNKSQEENIEQTNDTPSKNVQQSSANIEEKVIEKEMITKNGEDDEQLLEALSGRSTYSPYSPYGEPYDEDELLNMEYEDEFESDEEWITDGRQSLRKTKELFDPEQEGAVKLETDAETLVLSKLPRLEPSENQTSMERIFDIRMFSDMTLDTLSSSPSFEADEEGRKVDKGQEFFDKLANVPEVKDIKSDTSIAEEYKPRFYVKDHRSSVGGKFVHPLTGLSMSTLIIEEAKYESQELLERIEEDEEEQEQEFTKQEFEFDDFDSCYPDDQVDKTLKVTVKDETEVIEDLFIDERRLPTQVALIDDDQEEKDNLKMVESFFENLMNNIVQYYKRKETQQMVMSQLDKKFLFYEIDKLVKEYIMEKNVLSFLNRKVVNYYRRKRQIRYILPEKSENAINEYLKYKEASEYLNALMGREVATNKKTSTKIDELFIEVDEMEEMEREERSKFETLVRNTFKRENMPKLNEMIEKDLRKMSDLAKEISDVRAVHVSRQHMLGALKAQINELENIGNGLRVADYENIDREANRLEKKIEEHNAELQKLYRRFRSTIHTLAHSKLRNEMFVNNIKIQVDKLSLLVEEERRSRLHVYDCKMKRRRLMRNITDLSFQSGLLDKPAILIDYDETNDLLEKKRKEVESLRETHKKLEQKLKRAEAACNQKEQS